MNSFNTRFGYKYKLNYGIIEGCKTRKNTVQFAYIMGINHPVRNFDGRVIAIVVKGDDTISKLVDYVIELPETADFLYPLLASIPLQLLAYHIAVCKGKNVDQPRNLAKSVTVE